MSMLVWNDILKEQNTDNLNQEFFATSKNLQYQYNNLCNECTRLSSRYYQCLNNSDEEGAKVALEYLNVEKDKLEKFIAKYNIKF